MERTATRTSASSEVGEDGSKGSSIANPGDFKASTDNTPKDSGISCDPLKWFGILVPPALRASQSNFKAAVMDCIPKLATISNEMKEVEIEIRRTRKRLKKCN